MEINKHTSFISTYFDNKSGDNLRSSITPSWTAQTLKGHLNIIDVPDGAKKILEVGCGIGRILKEIYDTSEPEHYIGMDASNSMIDEGRDYIGDRNIDLIKCEGDGELELLKDDYFDFAFSIITFQHIPNTETVKRYLEEMVRVTRPGGEIMFQMLSEELNKGFLWSFHNLDEIYNYLKGQVESINIEKHDNWAVFRCKV